MRNWGAEKKTTLITASLIAISAAIIAALLSVITGAYPVDSPSQRVFWSRIIVLVVATQFLFIARLTRTGLWVRIQRFFAEESPPLNLAVFRVVLFGTIFFSLDVPNIAWFGQLPAELLVAPIGLEWLINRVPITETLASIAATVARVFCLTGMLGLFSRTSALLTTIFGLYALGIPQFFGKVNHYHHLLWFSAILAASRCGDTLSIDAVFAGWKRADRGVTEPPPKSSCYAQPLRFVWILIGIIYFFPGFWKIWLSGIDWAWSENIRNQIYLKTIEYDNWAPPLALDQFPMLYKIAGIAVILFELSFIFLIFSPRFRTLIVLLGLVFHNMTAAFMRISFWSLQTCYVAFVDWDHILRRLGRALFKERMYVVFDSDCKMWRRTIASLRVFDVFGQIAFWSSLETQRLKDPKFNCSDSTYGLTDILAIVGRKTQRGFLAYRSLAVRIPVLWPLLPFLYLWPVERLGCVIYRSIAASRTCSLVEAKALSKSGVDYRTTSYLLPVIGVGVMLVLTNILCGVTRTESAWPFACYPTFAGIAAPVTVSLKISPVWPTGQRISLIEDNLRRKFSPDRLRHLILHILSIKDAAERRLRLAALWKVWTRDELGLQDVQVVQFYRQVLLTNPQSRKQNPVHEELLFELKL